MSPNTPNHPEDENHGNAQQQGANVESQHDPLANNPYSAQARQARQPDLDSAAPQLTSTDMNRMNRRALGLLASIALLLVVIAIWAFNSIGGDKPKPKPREEVVSIPEAPRAPPQPVPAMPTPEPSQPIELAPAPAMPRNTPSPEPDRPRGPTLLERRIAAAGMGTTGVAEGGAPAVPGAPGAEDPTGAGQAGPYGGMPYIYDPNAAEKPRPRMSNSNNLAYTAKDLPEVSSAAPLTHPDTLMLRGTFIRCVLETRIVTDIPGFTSCIVTEPVYSFTGKRLLLPKGSKVMGKYEMEPDGPRVAVIWDRIVTPTGIDVNMASPGIDQLGGAGHPGHYNAHWGSRVGAALLISLLSDAFKYEAAKHGPKTTVVGQGFAAETPFESNTADTIQQLSNQAVQRAANRPATVTINQGTVLAVYVAKDVDFAGVVARY
ncbi:MAG: Type IV secretion system protein virB10 [Luteibacter sp.]|uniref:TrbI/VirB10 family protein n=1 Tax=Luteibacter sp. TaxID=1886636 RepID=UPI00137FDE83|nr:TrbI/VirB10 family protein [Luteibacter sp.]KAF1003143.1 MAG: Type IV secretion system protein virB10 [Luteibacter sp.]